MACQMILLHPSNRVKEGSVAHQFASSSPALINDQRCGDLPLLPRPHDTACFIYLSGPACLTDCMRGRSGSLKCVLSLDKMRGMKAGWHGLKKNSNWCEDEHLL